MPQNIGDLSSEQGGMPVKLFVFSLLATRVWLKSSLRVVWTRS